MSRILHDDQLGVDVRLSQAIIHQLGLFIRDQFIVIAMDQQEGRIVRSDIGNRAGLHDIMFTKTDALHGFNIGIGEIFRQVDDGSQGNDCLHAAGLIEILPHIEARA